MKTSLDEALQLQMLSYIAKRKCGRHLRSHSFRISMYIQLVIDFLPVPLLRQVRKMEGKEAFDYVYRARHTETGM